MFFVRRSGLYYGHGLSLLGWLLPVLLFAAMAGLLVFAVSRTFSHDGPGQLGADGVATTGPFGLFRAGPVGPGFATGYGSDPAMEQARVRYARGEMSREAYLRLVDDLHRGSGTRPGGPQASPASGGPFAGVDAPPPPPPPFGPSGPGGPDEPGTPFADVDAPLPPAQPAPDAPTYPA